MRWKGFPVERIDGRIRGSVRQVCSPPRPAPSRPAAATGAPRPRRQSFDDRATLGPSQRLLAAGVVDWSGRLGRGAVSTLEINAPALLDKWMICASNLPATVRAACSAPRGRSSLVNSRRTRLTSWRAAAAPCRRAPSTGSASRGTTASRSSSAPRPAGSGSTSPPRTRSSSSTRTGTRRTTCRFSRGAGDHARSGRPPWLPARARCCRFVGPLPRSCR